MDSSEVGRLRPARIPQAEPLLVASHVCSYSKRFIDQSFVHDFSAPDLVDARLPARITEFRRRFTVFG